MLLQLTETRKDEIGAPIRYALDNQTKLSKKWSLALSGIKLDNTAYVLMDFAYE